MGLFDKMFGSKSKQPVPNNSRLFELLEIYKNQNGTGDSYKNVILELMHGNSFLLLPSENDGEDSGYWTTVKKGTALKLTCVYNLDGLKVLGAFTDEDSLLNWAKRRTQYTALPSKDVIKLCEENLIERIVINSDLPTMFVLERNRENFKTENIEKDTEVQVGTPNNPLSKQVIENLKKQFSRVETIDEVYQYGQTKNGEFSIVLGFKLLRNSDNAKTAVINAVQTAFQGEEIGPPVDLFFIENEGWYNTIKNINNSFIYKR